MIRLLFFLTDNRLRCARYAFALVAGCAGVLVPPAAWAQSDSLSAITRRFDEYNRQTLVEKLFVHLDRPSYSAGDLLWLKVYATDGTYHRPLDLSKVAYVELLDEARRPVLQAKIALQEGRGQGALLLPATLATGRYVLRAYTSWMQNFSPDFYFHRSIVVLNTAQPLAAPPAASVPSYDLQFFPEGGGLVRGLPSRVGFKILDAAGNSLAVKGKILKDGTAAVDTFRTLKFGMGSFQLTPDGAAYSAVIELPDKTTLTRKLPAAQPQGFVLRLRDENADHLQLQVQTNVGAPGSSVLLLGHAGQRVVVAASARLQDGRATFQVAKRQLLPGITHFTLFDGQRQPLAERLYFRPGSAAAAVAVQADKSAYSSREKVSLQLSSSQAAAVSVAVFQLDSLSATGPADIRSYLLLSSELPGFIESPDYYFQDSSALGRAAADNLMLTQGWSRFRWRDVLAGTPPPLPHVPELRGHLLRARLTQPGTGAPAPGITTYLTAVARTGRFYHAQTAADGIAQFELNPFFGPRQLVVQTNPLRDSSYQVELLSPFSLRFATSLTRPLQLAELARTAVADRHLQSQVRAYFDRKQPSINLPASDTVAFYGQPSERYRLDDYTRFKVMEEVMREYVAGVMVRKKQDDFRFIVLNRVYHNFFEENPMVLLDGMPVFDINKIMAFDPLKVKQIDVLASRYYQGTRMWEGLVSYTTYGGDLGGFPVNPHALLEEYEGLQGQREFYAPRYETTAQKQSRLPDLRNLLYWNPDVSLAAGQPKQLDFYTSDQTGRYVVITQGMTANGPTDGQATFECQPAQ